MKNKLLISINDDFEGLYESIVLDENKEIIEPLLKRDLENLSELSRLYQTIIILPSNQFSLHQVPLPPLSTKKIRTALPFALEENLTEAVENLHFSFSDQFFKNGMYLVIVCSKHYFLKIITNLQAQNINIDTITIDFFALNSQESVWLNNYVLINEDKFQGALDFKLAEKYLQKITNYHTLHGFVPALQPNINNPAIETSWENMPEPIWLAKRIMNKNVMNLAQGEFQLKRSKENERHWYFLTAGLFLLWLITFFSINLYQLYKNHHETNAINKEIATIYFQFFPHATEVINPRFRITQLLKENASPGDNKIWLILSKIMPANAPQNIKIQALQWQNQVFRIKLVAANFQALEIYSNELKKRGLQLHQIQATKTNNAVESTLELRL